MSSHSTYSVKKGTCRGEGKFSEYKVLKEKVEQVERLVEENGKRERMVSGRRRSSEGEREEKEKLVGEGKC